MNIRMDLLHNIKVLCTFKLYKFIFRIFFFARLSYIELLKNYIVSKLLKNICNRNLISKRSSIISMYLVIYVGLEEFKNLFYKWAQ